MQTVKNKIRIKPEKCAQCLSCMLICSFIHSKSFNPSRAHIRIEPSHFVGETWVPIKIKILESCKPKCWLCTQYCAYGALEHMGGG